MISELAGQRVTRISIDWMFRLGTDGLWEIGSEGVAELHTSSETALRVEPTGEEAPLPEEFLALVGERIDSLTLNDSGDLTVDIGDCRLLLPASDRYESWAMGGPRGESVICMPGGELAEWGPRRDVPELTRRDTEPGPTAE